MSVSDRVRRSCLAVPGSSERFIAKARDLDVDEVFFDLEDACAPLAKPAARGTIVAALNAGGWGRKTRAVRVNDATTAWAYRDVVEITEGAGANVDCVILPKVSRLAHVQWLDMLLYQIEAARGLPPGGIGIEAQIEDAAGLAEVDAIAAASPRMEALVFGPADFAAAMNMPTLTAGSQPAGYQADAFHYVLMRILTAARANDLHAIDGPFPLIRDAAGFTAAARHSAALGFDGKWVLHPAQVEAAHQVYTPGQEQYDHAELVLEAYDWHISRAGGARGAAMLGDEMIDEASRKMALVVATKGRVAGLVRTRRFTAEDDITNV